MSNCTIVRVQYALALDNEYTILSCDLWPLSCDLRPLTKSLTCCDYSDSDYSDHKSADLVQHWERGTEWHY